MLKTQAIASPSCVVPELDFGRDVLGDAAFAAGREWLVTNGIGGFASGTIGDVPTRRYHGLLFAARKPPVGRTLLLAKLDASATYGAQTFALSANRWATGEIDPMGGRHIEHFRLRGTVPVWTFAIADALIERSIWMSYGYNTTYVRYEIVRGAGPVSLTIRALTDARDYHGLTHAYDAPDRVRTDGGRATVQLSSHAPTLYLNTDRGAFVAVSQWWNGFRLAAETERGLDDLEDHFHAVTLESVLAPGEAIVIGASDQPIDEDPEASLRAVREREVGVLRCWSAARTTSAVTPDWVPQLVLAADQFIVERKIGDARGETIIAGYPWFGDWGRDTMIALPGLTLTTGRAPLARSILRVFAAYIDRGMLPNRFPDDGEPPEYNTVDATLWYVEALRRYHAVTGDDVLIDELFDGLLDIVRAHRDGTRFGIHLAEDGLLYSGEDGVQLTWMDAKVGDDVITPRTGKAVEINALWYNAVRTIEVFATRLGRDATDIAPLVDRARSSFGKFWNPAAAYPFDVIDGPNGNDAAIRPNAVIAASLTHSPFDMPRTRAIVDRAAASLYTAYGLRSLAPDDAQYRGRYTGGSSARDRAYHQGTVWPWLLGPFVDAHLRAYGRPDLAATYLEGARDLTRAYGIGTIAEIAEGEAPHRPVGCIAQAWSVAELLRAWHACTDAASPKETTR